VLLERGHQKPRNDQACAMGDCMRQRVYEGSVQERCNPSSDRECACNPTAVAPHRSNSDRAALLIIQCCHGNGICQPLHCRQSSSQMSPWWVLRAKKHLPLFGSPCSSGRIEAQTNVWAKALSPVPTSQAGFSNTYQAARPALSAQP